MLDATSGPSARESQQIDPRVASKQGPWDKTYLRALAVYRRQWGGHPSVTPPISVFGYLASGVISATRSWPTTIVEWAAEAGARLWIVRASNELAPEEGQTAFERSLAGLTWTASSIATRATIAAIDRLVAAAGCNLRAPGDR